MTWLVDWWDHVSGTVLQGLGITVVGMALVFFTLGLVIAAMVLLTRLPWLRGKETGPAAAPVTPSQPENDTGSPTHDDDLAAVAAIAVAVLRSRQGTGFRQRGKPRRSMWRSYGRAHQLGL